MYKTANIFRGRYIEGRNKGSGIVCVIFERYTGLCVKALSV